MTVNEFIQRIDNHNIFTSNELAEIFYGDFDLTDTDYEEVDHIYNTSGRWNHQEYYIYRIGDRYFKCGGYIANTEYQEDIFDDQPIEVKPVEKTIIVYEEVTN